MKVLLQARRNLLKKPGGDTNQILILKKYLAQMGIEALLSCELEPDLKGIDLVHCFNLSRPEETVLQIRNAARYGRRIVLHAMYQNLDEYERRGRRGFPSQALNWIPVRFRELLRFFYHLGAGNLSWKRIFEFLQNGGDFAMLKALKDVSLLIVHTEMEKEAIRDCFFLEDGRDIAVIPPMLDGDEFVIEDYQDSLVPFDDYFLCVGRVEDLKNQTGIAKACLDADRFCVFAGPENQNHRHYASLLRKMVKSNPHQLLWMENPKRSEILSLMAGCRAHIQTSWFETAGIASLEALAFGKPLICSTIGYAREIFQEHALYCD
ncbi:MAG: glycosyltransferase family 4 protein, partial [Candidatus Cloacimonetes bacterium]|nr:glycosyltransferase family 4 protein [Candidatus Cloacimonadota bacterium]